MIATLNKLAAATVICACANALAADPLNSTVQVYMPDRIITFEQCTYGIGNLVYGEIEFTSYCKIKNEQPLPAINRRKVPYAIQSVSIGSLTTDPHAAFVFHASKCDVDSHKAGDITTLAVIRCNHP